MDDDDNNTFDRSSHLSFVVVGSWIAWTIFSSFVIVLAYRRRHRQPLKARSPIMTLISALGGYILLTWCTFVYGNVFNALDIHDEKLYNMQFLSQMLSIQKKSLIKNIIHQKQMGLVSFAKNCKKQHPCSLKQVGN